METKTTPSMWKRIARATLCVAAGSLLLAGCVSSSASGLSEAEMNQVRPWYVKADMLQKSLDPDLRAPSKTKILPLDIIADAVMPLSKQTAIDAEIFVRNEIAETAWDRYMSTTGDSVSSKLEREGKKDELKNRKLQLAKINAFPSGLTLTEGGLDERARKMLEFQRIQNNASLKAEERILKQVALADETPVAVKWAEALVAGQNKKDGYEKFFNTVNPKTPKIQSVSGAERIAQLTEQVSRLAAAGAQLAQAMKDPNVSKTLAKARFGVSVVEGVDGKETIKLVERLQKQIKVSSELSKQLLKAQQDRASRTNGTH